MYIALTEAQKESINENAGMMVIEFKRELRKRSKTVETIWQIVDKVISGLREMFDRVRSVLCEFGESLKVMLDMNNTPSRFEKNPGQKYRFFKYISKCSGKWPVIERKRLYRCRNQL